MNGINLRINSQEIVLPIQRNRSGVKSGPQYHALIGPNGAYKSEILSALAAHYGRIKPTGFVEIVGDQVDSFEFPKKVVALSTSPFCKFPVAKSILSKVKRKSKSHEDTILNEQYAYLGTKSTSIYTSNLRDRLYDLLLRASIAAVQQEKLFSIQKTFDFLGLKREVLFRFSLKFELEHVTSLIKKRVAKSDYERVIEFMHSPKFKDFFRPKMKSPGGGTFQLNFSSSASASKIDINFFINMEILRKAHLLDILGVTVQPANESSSPVVHDISLVSSGKSSLLLSFLGLSSVTENGSFILIDEPEIGLHPGAQAKYVAFLDELLKVYDNLTVIIATHSPHILSSLPSDRSQVLSLKVEDTGNLQVKKLLRNIQGWSAEDVLLDVFGISSTRTLDVASHAMTVAEMIAAIVPYDENVFARSLSRIKRLELPEHDSLQFLVKEAEVFLERRSRGT